MLIPYHGLEANFVSKKNHIGDNKNKKNDVVLLGKSTLFINEQKKCQTVSVLVIINEQRKCQSVWCFGKKIIGNLTVSAVLWYFWPPEKVFCDIIFKHDSVQDLNFKF